MPREKEQYSSLEWLAEWACWKETLTPKVPLGSLHRAATLTPPYHLEYRALPREWRGEHRYVTCQWPQAAEGHSAHPKSSKHPPRSGRPLPRYHWSASASLPWPALTLSRLRLWWACQLNQFSMKLCTYEGDPPSMGMEQTLRLQTSTVPANKGEAGFQW